MLNTKSALTVAFLLFAAPIDVNAKNLDACETLAYIAPTPATIGRSELSCPLHRNGATSKLITEWKMVDGSIVQGQSHAEVVIAGKTHSAPIGQVFDADDLSLGARVQLVDCNGYYDLKLPIGSTDSRNPNFATWRFDDKIKSYVLHKALTALRNPTPLAGCGCYTTYLISGSDFTYELWCVKAGVWSRTHEVVQKWIGPPKTIDIRDYPDPICDVTDTRADASGKTKTRRSKRCTDLGEVFGRIRPQ